MRHDTMEMIAALPQPLADPAHTAAGGIPAASTEKAREAPQREEMWTFQQRLAFYFPSISHTKSFQ